MKIKLCILLLALPFALSAQKGGRGDCACFDKKSKRPPLYAGPQFGAGLLMYDNAFTSTSDQFVMSPGFVFGTHLTSFLSLQFGANYSKVKNITNDLPVINISETCNVLNMEYVDIPVELQMRMIVKNGLMLYLDGGASNSVLLRGKYTGDCADQNHKTQYSQLYLKGGLGFGYVIKKKVIAYLQADYFHGMLPLDEKSFPDYSQKIAVATGINFTF